MSARRPVPLRSAAYFGLAVRERRHDRGLSQRELADLSGLDQATISRIESRRHAQLLSNMIEVLRPLGGRLVLEFDDADGTAADGDESPNRARG